MSISTLRIDDFDPLIRYSSYGDWTTPDPSLNPTFWNASSEVTGVNWHEATYHATTVAGTTASLNFTGSSIKIYGTTTQPFTLTLDPNTTYGYTSSQQPTQQAQGNDTRILLYENDTLSYGRHEVVVGSGDGGGELVLDLWEVGYLAGGDGATYTNYTIDDTAGTDQLNYEGTWTRQNRDAFNGTSTYCQGPGNDFTLTFIGSSIYVYGDQVNDHGPFSIYFNDSTTAYQTLNGRSGCGVAEWQKSCEKLGGMKFFASGLPEGRHTLRLVNVGYNLGEENGNQTFFDFDYAEYTVPSVYSNYSTNPSLAGECFVNCTGTNAVVGGGGGTTSGGGSASSASMTAAPSGSASAGSGSTGSGFRRIGGWSLGSLGLTILGLVVIA